MKKQKILKSFKNLTAYQQAGILGLAALFIMTTIATPFVLADQYEEQIKALNQDSGNKRAAQSQLGAEAATLSDVISKLQAEINALQAKIVDNQNKVTDLNKQIAAAEEELKKQRGVLGENIKQMYLDEDISTLEMLASSKNLSDFFDKQQYRESVRSKIKATVDKITQLKLDLATQRDTVEKLIAEQQGLQSKVVAQRSENDRLLGLNQSQQNELNGQIKANSTKVAELRRLQAIENAKHGSGVVSGDPSKGGYPAMWANAPQDSLLDSWGMYNRECVSYTAWKVHQSGRFMPYWGGRGNANQWPDNTSNKGKTPQVGAVAIAYWGYYGHSMYVEAVSGNRVYVSQYNYGVRGEYSEMWVNVSEIGWFLYF